MFPSKYYCLFLGFFYRLATSQDKYHSLNTIYFEFMIILQTCQGKKNLASTRSRITPINYFYFIFREIRRLFQEHIRGSGLTGYLDFSEAVNTLEIKVKPRDDSQYVPLTSLSGGEKSKTLACLIRAFWQFQSNPFRFVYIFCLFTSTQWARKIKKVRAKKTHEMK